MEQQTLYFLCLGCVISFFTLIPFVSTTVSSGCVPMNHVNLVRGAAPVDWHSNSTSDPANRWRSLFRIHTAVGGTEREKVQITNVLKYDSRYKSLYIAKIYIYIWKTHSLSAPFMLFKERKKAYYRYHRDSRGLCEYWNPVLWIHLLEELPV